MGGFGKRKKVREKLTICCAAHFLGRARKCYSEERGMGRAAPAAGEALDGSIRLRVCHNDRQP